VASVVPELAFQLFLFAPHSKDDPASLHDHVDRNAIGFDRRTGGRDRPTSDRSAEAIEWREVDPSVCAFAGHGATLRGFRGRVHSEKSGKNAVLLARRSNEWCWPHPLAAYCPSTVVASIRGTMMA
jgi:hypothetical protein